MLPVASVSGWTRRRFLFGQMSDRVAHCDGPLFSSVPCRAWVGFNFRPKNLRPRLTYATPLMWSQVD